MGRFGEGVLAADDGGVRGRRLMFASRRLRGRRRSWAMMLSSPRMPLAIGIFRALVVRRLPRYVDDLVWFDL